MLKNIHSKVDLDSVLFLNAEQLVIFQNLYTSHSNFVVNRNDSPHSMTSPLARFRLDVEEAEVDGRCFAHAWNATCLSKSERNVLASSSLKIETMDGCHCVIGAWRQRDVSVTTRRSRDEPLTQESAR